MKFIEIPFQNKKVGLWYIYYYEGLAFQFAMFLELPLEHFNQVGVRHLVVKDGALTMLYEASWRLLIGVIKCQHIDMSNLNPNQNRIEIKSINWHGRFVLISIWQVFFWQPPLFAVFVLHGFRIARKGNFMADLALLNPSKKNGLHEMHGFSNCF